MVADIFLYHADLVEEGKRKGDLRERLEKLYVKARHTFRARVPERVWRAKDHLRIELDQKIAEEKTDQVAEQG